jgi:zinc ribbon protein
MEWLILVILIGLIPAAIAKSKGRSFGAWWFYGSLLFIVALPHALIMSPNTDVLESRKATEEGRRPCPHCAELIKIQARVCRYCGRDVPAIVVADTTPKVDNDPPRF